MMRRGILRFHAGNFGTCTSFRLHKRRKSRKICPSSGIEYSFFRGIFSLRGVGKLLRVYCVDLRTPLTHGRASPAQLYCSSSVSHRAALAVHNRLILSYAAVHFYFFTRLCFSHGYSISTSVLFLCQCCLCTSFDFIDQYIYTALSMIRTGHACAVGHARHYRAPLAHTTFDYKVS